MEKPIKVMIADDASVTRNMLEQILHSDEGIELVAIAVNGKEALDYVTNNQDVEILLLDIQMPVMDGLEALPLIIKANPKIKVLIVSALSGPDSEYTIQALTLGAVDYIEKPHSRALIDHFSRELLLKIKYLGMAGRGYHTTLQIVDNIKPPTDTIELRPIAENFQMKIIAIASSTGGPRALIEVLGGLSVDFLRRYPIFITQHIKNDFVKLLVDNLNSISKIRCKEAENGEKVEKGVAYIAASDSHLELYRKENQLYINLSDAPQENFCRPSADPMFRSLAKITPNVLAIVLTGIGQDGLAGAKEIVKVGGVVIAQDKETSVVWGMPGAVATNGLCSEVLPLYKISSFIEKRFS